MYSVGYGQMATLPLIQTGGAGAPVPAATQAQAKATIDLMQMSLNRSPAQGGVGAAIAPRTGIFDAKTENALKLWLRTKGAPVQIVPGMWANIVKTGFGEVGAKQWEAAIAFYKKWGAATTQAKVMTPKFQLKIPVSKMSVAAQPVKQAVKQATFKPFSPAPLPTAAPALTLPITPRTFVTYPTPDSGVAPLGPAPFPPDDYTTPDGQMVLMQDTVLPAALTEKKKGLPTWGWIAIGLGGAAVLGGGLWLVVRAKRGS